ncbi:MAG: penicillin-binding protein 2 [Spirochaetia bacterium]|jgi:penicillin-binding protein 2|nr:penicillin-binding protein 2 [Spirochaetia bacterium]
MTGGDFHAGSKESLKSRITVVLIFSLTFLAAYSVYLFSLQIVKGLEYKKMAWAVAMRESVISTQRGEIFDRNYDLPLVTNVDLFAVEIIPAELEKEKIDDVVKKLAIVLDLDENVIRKKIPTKVLRQYKPIEIKDDIKYEKVLYIAENIEKFPGVTWRSKPIRSYLDTASISHILGYVGDITREELQVLYNSGYAPDSELGKMGIEKQYDMLLRGETGRRYSTVDVRGRKTGEFGETEEKPPVIGKSLVLTIDRHIQKLCEKALGERVGSVVVMKPSTGEILAMVSYPWYNPNEFYEDTRSEYFKSLALDSGFPFLNRAVQSTYAPASVFKFVLTTAILEEEVFPPWEKIECKGSIHLGDRTFNCHKKTGHGYLDLAGALAESCDVYYWTVGREYLGVERITDYARRFGFGQKTGIDIPGEAKGLVPTPEWKDSAYHVPWLGGDTFNISIGQGYLETSPLQVANAVSMIVNEGVNYVPHFIKQIRDPVSGEILEKIEPKILHNTAIRKETFRKVKENMRGVITKGTARVVLTTKAVEVAGKTGTGEVGFKDRWTSWFAAYGPYNSTNPEEQVVVVVMVEAVNEWEWWAPKATNVIFQGIFADQNYEEAAKDLNIWYLKTPRDIIRARVE